MEPIQPSYSLYIRCEDDIDILETIQDIRNELANNPHQKQTFDSELIWNLV